MMEKLGFIDHLFYKFDAGGLSPILMAGAMIVDPAGSPYPVNGKLLAEHLAARMERVPLLRKRLVQDSLNIGQARLVDDPDFDVRKHITRIKLKAPGGYKELMDCLGAFSSQPIDLTQPLWHYQIIEGLKGGRFAIALHLHHAIMDGVGAMKALGGMWDSKPVPAEKPRTTPWPAKELPTSAALLRNAVVENVVKYYYRVPLFLLKNSSPILKMLANTVSDSLGEKGSPEIRDHAKIPKVRRTSLNRGKLSGQRVVSCVEFPLAEAKALSRHFSCSMNDLALLINSYALEHYFTSTGEKINFDLVAGMPINIRKESDGVTGNAVTVARVNLHNQIKGVVPRLRAIVNDTSSIKRPSKNTWQGTPLNGQVLMGLFSPILFDALVLAIVKFNLLEKGPPLLNFAITNVPGSPEAQYLAGAKLVSGVPMAPAIDSVGMTITVSSTGDHFTMGYHGCGKLVKDKELFVEGARKAYAALKAAAKLPAKTATRTPAKAPAKIARTKAASRSGGKVGAKSPAKSKPAAAKTSSKARRPARSRSQSRRTSVAA